MQDKLGGRGRSLEKRFARAGRLLPKRIRRAGRRITEAQAALHHPKLARLQDPKALNAAFAEITAHLKTIDPADRRKGLVLGHSGWADLQPDPFGGCGHCVAALAERHLKTVSPRQEKTPRSDAARGGVSYSRDLRGWGRAGSARKARPLHREPFPRPRRYCPGHWRQDHPRPRRSSQRSGGIRPL